MSELPQDPDRSAYDPTVKASGAPDPEPAPVESRALPPFREVAEIRKPSTLGGVIHLAVLCVGIIGVLIALAGSWRTGVAWLAAGLLGAAVARVLLPDDNAGMLRVRRKWVDVVGLAAVGAVLVFLVASIPDQPR